MADTPELIKPIAVASGTGFKGARHTSASWVRIGGYRDDQ